MRMILDHDRCTLLHGDSSELAIVLPENSVDAIVTDPPSGIGFMAKGWDKDRGGRDAWVAWLAQVLAPSYRALRPGAHGLVWALPRTSHWTAYALEATGFEIRDRVSHIFLNGFPKSLTSKSADIPAECGTALKPAVEDWWLVRKPLDRLTVAECWQRHRTGVLWIDRCRVGDEDTRAPTGNRPDNGWGMGQGTVAGSEHGRWPPHLLIGEGAPVNDIDDPARYFYAPKPSRSEKDQGLEHLPASTGGAATGREDGSAGLSNPRAGAGRTGGARNVHPTVKSIALMRWLCRLITPPGGVILDPFAGSGSTGVAALAEGFGFVGCEQGGGDGDPYLPILLGRIRSALGA